jgi:hypothetical protein
MAVGEAVDPAEHFARLPRLIHVEPADLRFAHAGFAESFAGALEFGQGANAVFTQARNQRNENIRGGD